MKENIFETNLIPENREPLKSTTYSDVLIDIDSCLASFEGIDMLARIRGVEDQITNLTCAAMEGRIPLEDIFARRLEIINPTFEDLITVAAYYTIDMTHDSSKTVEILQENGVNIHLLSGGFDFPARFLGRFLGIPMENIYTNKLFFENYRKYIGFDTSIPLWKSDGKRQVIKDLKAQGRLGSKIAIVGDGVSELDASSETDLFIGFGAHAWRQKVEEGADVFINDPTFSILLPFLLDEKSLFQVAANEKNRGVLGEAFAALSTTRFNSRACDLQQELFEIERQLGMMYR